MKRFTKKVVQKAARARVVRRGKEPEPHKIVTYCPHVAQSDRVGDEYGWCVACLRNEVKTYRKLQAAAAKLADAAYYSAIWRDDESSVAVKKAAASVEKILKGKNRACVASTWSVISAMMNS